MKLHKIGLKVFSVMLSAALIVAMFAGCSSKKTVKEDTSKTWSAKNNAEDKKPSLEPGARDKHLYPDVSNIELSNPSESERSCKTEEECIEVLNTFTNPNGNEFDAVSVLGKFRYQGKTDEEIMNKLKNASTDWHKTVSDIVGDKCIVKIELLEKNPVDLNDTKVSDWNAANGKTAQAFSNVKCNVSTNYANNVVKISFDIVKTDGNWYLANTSTVNKIQSVIMNEIYK